uniref:Uncharacterized protein n=1 Tax=Globodera rostochiensis TaxID=31243 RepID=A0A914I5A5_GLORO
MDHKLNWADCGGSHPEHSPIHPDGAGMALASRHHSVFARWGVPRHFPIEQRNQFPGGSTTKKALGRQHHYPNPIAGCHHSPPSAPLTEPIINSKISQESEQKEAEID